MSRRFIGGTMSIPFLNLKPQFESMKDEINQRIQTILEHQRFIMGPEVTECEEALSKFSGSKHSVSCASGTDALIMALMALNIGPGDEVITTSFSFIATAESIALVGATPVFVDIDKDTFNIDPLKVEEAISEKTKAIIPVSLFGLMPDMNAIKTIAKKHNLYVIEDGAQSFGAEYFGQKSCSLADISCTSFFPAKPLGCYGDGGAVFTDSDEIHKELLSIRVHGQSDHRYKHRRLGINGRLDSIQCAVVTEKLKRFPWELEQRQKVAEKYNNAFADYTDKIIPPKMFDNYTSAWAQYTLQSDNREALQEKLKEKGVPTAVYYPILMSDHEPYKPISRTMDLSVSREMTQKVFSIPIYADLEEATQDKIIEAVISSL